MSRSGRAEKILRERVSLALDILSRLLSEDIKTRDELRKLVATIYRKKAMQPIRGRAWPRDIWDKELSTLYVVAKYGLNLFEEEHYADKLRRIFGAEEALEEAANAILKEEDLEKARTLASFYLGGSIEDNTIARMLRVVATAALFGYRDPDDVEKLLIKTAKVFPEQQQTVRKYAKYYIALRVAQAIAAGEVRSRLEKEALKQALAARIGLEKIIPDDEYVAYIAQTVFSVSKKRLEKVLGEKYVSKHRRGTLS